jgi:hypothetical protein
MRWMVKYEYEIPGGALNLSSTKLLLNVRGWRLIRVAEDSDIARRTVQRAGPDAGCRNIEEVEKEVVEEEEEGNEEEVEEDDEEEVE